MLKFITLLGVGITVVLTSVVDATPLARHERATLPEVATPISEPTPVNSTLISDQALHDQIAGIPSPETVNQTTPEEPSNPNNTKPMTKHTQFVLNSISEGFGHDASEASGFGNLVGGVIGIETKNDITEKQPTLGGMSLTQIIELFGMGKFDGKASKTPRASTAKFSQMLKKFGMKRDRNAPGGSGPEGGSYDLLNVLKLLAPKTGKTGGEASLGMLVGSLFNTQLGNGNGSLGIGGNVNGGLASMLAGFLKYSIQ